MGMLFHKYVVGFVVSSQLISGGMIVFNYPSIWNPASNIFLTHVGLLAWLYSILYCRAMFRTGFNSEGAGPLGRLRYAFMGSLFVVGTPILFFVGYMMLHVLGYACRAEEKVACYAQNIGPDIVPLATIFLLIFFGYAARLYLKFSQMSKGS